MPDLPASPTLGEAIRDLLANDNQIGSGSEQIAPGDHNHSLADVAGLEAELTEIDAAIDGKAPISHTHSADSIVSGTLPVARGGTGAATAQAAIDALTGVSGATAGHVLTKDGSGNATFQAPTGGGGGGGSGDMTAAVYDPTVKNADAFARANHHGTQAISTVTGLQTALDGKAAAAHTQAISTVTGLQTALDGKAAAAHTHAQANITGLTTTDSPQFVAVNFGHATDTTLARSAAGQLALEGVAVLTASNTATVTGKSIDAAQLTGNVVVARFNGGSGASSGTFWRGDGTWAAPALAGITGLEAALADKNRLERATTDPTPDDDSEGTAGNGSFVAGNHWANEATGRIFELRDATPSAAVWVPTGSVAKDGTPVAGRGMFWSGDGTAGHSPSFLFDPATGTLTVAKIVVTDAEQLPDPNANSLLGWNDTLGTSTWLGLANGMEMAGGNVGLTANQRTAAVEFVIDGGGSAITAGQKGHIVVPFACTITRSRLLADQTGSIVVDIWKDTYANYPPADADSITGSATPTISAGVKAENTSLTGWTTGIAAGDVLAFNVDSASAITRVLVSLTVVVS